MDPLPLDLPLTIHFPLNFYHFLPYPPSPPSTRCHKSMVPYLKSPPFKFVYLQNFTEKQKCLNLGPKVPDLGIFGLEFKKTIVIFEISTFGLV